MPDVVAHRGFHLSAPENTLGAFVAAVELGADAVELDLQETADNRLVVHHDDTLDGVAISTLTLEQVRSRAPLPACPLFENVLDAVGEATGLDIEVKQANAATVAAAIGEAPGCIATSFDPDVLRALAKLAPRASRGLIVDVTAPAAAPEELIRRAEAASAQFMVVNEQQAEPELLEALAAGLGPSYVWTVNSEAGLRRLLASEHLSGVITDRPDLALSLRPQFTS